jgi:quercetin dioxygenase-like cupin family protein
MRQNVRLKQVAIAITAFVAIGAFGAACAATSNIEPRVDPDGASLPRITWGPAPAVFPPGAEMAVVQGDPSKAGQPFIVRLRLPNGYRIAPHTHPSDEHVTVISGAFAIGMGSTFSESALTTLPAGAFATAPAGHAHFAQAKGATVVQVNAIGPFAITYVNPSDTPR